MTCNVCMVYPPLCWTCLGSEDVTTCECACVACVVQVTKAVSVYASNAPASAAQSYFKVSGTFKIGDYLIIMVTLKSVQGILATKADKVTVQVTGKIHNPRSLLAGLRHCSRDA